MAIVKKIKLAFHSHIENLDDSGNIDGYPEITDTVFDAEMRTTDSCITLSYTENSEGGKIACEIKARDGEITVCRRGAINSTLVFREGESYSTLYEIPPFKFDMQIKTRRLKNSRSFFGGAVDILYTMSVGGADKRCRMKLTVDGGSKL